MRLRSIPAPIELWLVKLRLRLYPRTRRRVPHIPDFLWSFVGSLNFMRLSLKKGAHAVLSRAAYRKFGASRSFFARCGMPQTSPSSLLRSSQLRTGAGIGDRGPGKLTPCR